MKTTLNAIRAHSPCANGWAKLLRHLGKTTADDEPLLIRTILESNGLDDALWCLCAVTGHDRELRLYAVACVRDVQHLMTDPRSLAALDVAERFANGQATADELAVARDAAWSVDKVAYKAADRAAAWATARAADRAAAGDVARAAAWATARTATETAATAVTEAAATARDAAWSVDRNAAWAAARAKQAARLIALCERIEAEELP
jgi:hypothetical protein